MRITFLIRHVYGMGGTIKTTLNTAQALIDQGHEVEIASVVRARTEPMFPIDPRIQVTSLWDVRRREDGGEILGPVDRFRRRRPSIMGDLNNMNESSHLMDQRIKKFLRTVDTDILVGTHASLNLYMAEFGRPDLIKVGQEHLWFGNYKSPNKDRILSSYQRLDAYETLTEDDAEDYRKAMLGYQGIVRCVPNSVPPIDVNETVERDPIIMAVGRLAAGKRFNQLITAFSFLSERYPDWELHIYGKGPKEAELKRQIAELDLQGQVKLMGAVTDLDEAWSHASISAVTSSFEGFGLVIVEAMSAGVPTVCTKVPRGPLELIDDGTNGIFVEKGKPRSIARGIELLMTNTDLRFKLADAGRETARRYTPENIVQSHEDLFAELLDRGPLART